MNSFMNGPIPDHMFYYVSQKRKHLGIFESFFFCIIDQFQFLKFKIILLNKEYTTSF